MNDFYKALPHLLMATVVIAAVTVLAATGTMTGGEVLPVIAAAGGFTLGGTVASGSASTATAATVEASASTLEKAATIQAGSTPTNTPEA